jgi:hypothetical protein
MSRGKNALKNGYLQKAIWYIESEIDLLKLLFLQGKQSVTYTAKHLKSKIYFIPKSDGLGIIGLGEIATSLQLTHEFFDENGNPSALDHIFKALEEAFNYNHGDVYKSKSTIFRRKAYNRTKALDYLRNLLIREGRKMEKLKMKKDDYIQR